MLYNTLNQEQTPSLIAFQESHVGTWTFHLILWMEIFFFFKAKSLKQISYRWGIFFLHLSCSRRRFHHSPPCYCRCPWIVCMSRPNTGAAVLHGGFGMGLKPRLILPITHSRRTASWDGSSHFQTWAAPGSVWSALTRGDLDLYSSASYCK